MKKLIKFLGVSLAALAVMSMSGCGNNVSTSSTGDSDDVAATADSSDTLVWATNAEFEPYEYVDGDSIVGIDADLANAIAEKLGKKAEVMDMAFDSVIPAVTSGKADIGMAGITATDERKQSVNFSDSYVEAGQVIVVRKGSDIVDEASLADKTIGVQLGTTGDLYLTENIPSAEIDRLPKGADAIQELISGRIDAVVIDNQPAKKFVEANSDKLEIVATPLTQESYAIAVAKDNDELLNEINEALQELKSTGELDAILDKYLSTDEPVESATEAATSADVTTTAN
jgi:polar amino acid transport system substrate-binding protein